MRRRFAVFLGLIVLATAIASSSHAGVPSPGESTFPHHVLLVGTDAAGVADPAGTLSFHIVHYAGHPYPDPYLVLDFSGQYWERSDFDGSGALGTADLSLWTSLFFANGSLRSCSGGTCP